MNRREFVIAGAALSLVPLAAQAESMVYSPGLVKKELDAGKTVFLDFTATWCTTCQSQGRTIEALRAENPAYEAVSFIEVDWDNYGNGDLAKALKIPRRSTLVVLKGNKELGRIVAGTSKKEIKQLMDIALNAATS